MAEVAEEGSLVLSLVSLGVPAAKVEALGSNFLVVARHEVVEEFEVAKETAPEWSYSPVPIQKAEAMRSSVEVEAAVAVVEVALAPAVPCILVLPQRWLSVKMNIVSYTPEILPAMIHKSSTIIQKINLDIALP